MGAPEALDKAPRSELWIGSNQYPAGLRHLAEPPKKLYILGDAQLLGSAQIAIVGARRPTPYGLSCARRFAMRAADWGIVVVSGGALGCDQAAHRGALEAGGKTIVVLGCGADHVYPPRAGTLFEKIVQSGGAIVSEVPWGSSPTRWAFSKRNRIIAGLAKTTLIVEAGLPSGTFQTADSTLALGHELLVVPGAISSQESRGSNRLIREGATPIVDDDSFDDALRATFSGEEPCFSLATKSEVNDQKGEVDCLFESDSQHKIVAALRAEAMRPEELAAALTFDLLDTIRLLSLLELNKHVQRLRDGRYSTVF
ncbi:MAG: DNA-processing protein DprA [Coriobacteriales bacterium]|jgi:DNA processing protein|nr:DNA-processing protein DprA [Coriobacteriales bacterium]